MDQGDGCKNVIGFGYILRVLLTCLAYGMYVGNEEKREY